MTWNGWESADPLMLKQWEKEDLYNPAIFAPVDGLITITKPKQESFGDKYVRVVEAHEA